MLFIQKEGVYAHGIFWAGEIVEEGIEKCKEFAAKDRDNYHEWVLYSFVEQDDFEGDPEHVEVFKCTK